jgi:hypothetical protein
MATALHDQHSGEKHSNGAILCLLAADIRQTAQQLCEEALIAQQEAQEMVCL